jgi:hypothetical protein
LVSRLCKVGVKCLKFGHFLIPFFCRLHLLSTRIAIHFNCKVQLKLQAKDMKFIFLGVPETPLTFWDFFLHQNVFLAAAYSLLFNSWLALFASYSILASVSSSIESR